MKQVKELIEEGESLTTELEAVTEDSIYTICYTSGTTGNPKGAMLSHGNFVCNIGSMEVFDSVFSVQADDSYISYLPLAHVFERFMYLFVTGFGVKYGFFQGDVLKLREDLAVLQPTLMISVPRLYNRFYDTMQARIKELTGMKRKMAEWGVQKKLEALKHNAVYTNSFYDTLVFSKFRQVLGGKVRLMITGSAPIAKDVLQFLKIAFCCPILEGYG